MSAITGTELATYLSGIKPEAQGNADPEAAQGVVQPMQSTLDIPEASVETGADTEQHASLDSFIPTQGLDLA